MRTQQIVQCHIRCARDGDVIDGVTVSKTVAPDFTPSTNWTKISESIAECTEELDRGPTIDGMKTVGGTRQLAERFAIGPSFRKVTWTQEDTDERIIELMTMSGKIDASAAVNVGDAIDYVPLSGPATGIYGWYHLQYYNQANEIYRVEMVWGELKLGSGVKHGSELTKPSLELTVYANPLNAGKMYRTSNAT